MKQILATGILGSTYGVKGFIKVRPFSDDFSHFFKLKEVTIHKGRVSKVLKIEKVENHGGELIIKFSGYDSPEESKLIAGWEILVPREQASKLGNNQVYTADLIDLSVIYNNEKVGTVVSTIDGAQTLLLEVESLEGKHFLVPFYKGIYIDNIDLENGTIQLLNKDLMQ